MPLSTQFSIRGMLILTLAVAIVCTVVTPAFRKLDPGQQPDAIRNLAVLGIVIGATSGLNCLQRRRIEKKAGRLLSRTRIAGGRLRAVSVILAISLFAAAAYGAVLFAAIVSSPDFLVGTFAMMVGSFALFYGCEAGKHCLLWWWGAGFLVTEAFQGGLVLRGTEFKPWADLESYESSRTKPTVLVVNELTERATRPIRIRVAAKDRADWERILAEHGVPPADRLLKSGDALSTEPST